ncbi:PilX N-terminal domain-containing pilus assembly protein [Silanimonas sp.]|uniref:pilus assembly PilX family protein n=1 Tax=Silanimonas sp. TaxID=1929290 RepID=UPI0022C1FE43|nr:PilX N-terminal domain-containing pilus assembly protein [Silanimonas sp.]MCZ8164820.1 PilX N-terminal domain-containing pilus assembly protein [Silanimonas sp.]
MTRPTIPSFARATIQRGAALYVAMIMLLLLTLIGVAAMQVASLQQRMATNFNDFSLAFQRAEGVLRQGEFELQRSFDTGVLRAETYCLGDATNWANTIEPEAVPAAEVRKIYGGACPGARPIDPTAEGGVPAPGELDYQLIAAAADRDPTAFPTSVVVIETVYVVPPQARTP